MRLDVVTTALSAVLARVRGEEPSARAFFLYGSLARGEHGAFSDVDVRVVTDGVPRTKARMRVLDVEGTATHLSISARDLAGMETSARTPGGWAWIAGFVEVAHTLDDPGNNVRTRLRNACIQPARLESESGMSADLEDMIEHLAKTRNALARGQDALVMRHAWNVAKNARRALVPFGPVEPARRGGETEERALATMPPAFLADLALAGGEVTHAREPLEVAQAAARSAMFVVQMLEQLEQPPLPSPLLEDLLEGRLRALVARFENGRAT